MDTFHVIASGSVDWADGNRHAAGLSITAGDAGRVARTVDVPDDRRAAACAVAALGELIDLKAIGAVGHRVVHGGADYGAAAAIDDAVLASIARWSKVAPLHNPPALAAIGAAQAALPQAAQVAVFDTAFYAHLPPRTFVYPVPYCWYADWGIRRFGFHGISHKYCTLRVAELLGRDPAALRIVSCHLGGGCSATAVKGGRPVATTMGFTPIEGLMMGTRSGAVDPGILLHVARQHGLSIEQIDEALNQRSGLLGISGIAPDTAKIETAAAAGNSRARLALDMFADRVRAAIGALAVSMGGVDAILFTDRIGENSVLLRAEICAGLECLGLRLNDAANASCRPDCDVAATDSVGRVFVIHTREELMIAREAGRFL